MFGAHGEAMLGRRSGDPTLDSEQGRNLLPARMWRPIASASGVSRKAACPILPASVARSSVTPWRA
jgi:hypothetical protein